MKRLIIFVLFALAAWFGWNNYRRLLERQPSHEAVVENLGDAAIERVRVRVDGQTLVKEVVAGGEKAVLPFRVNRESSFELEWRAGANDHRWAGGLVTAGPMVQRHVFAIDDNGEVLYRAENK